MLLETSPQILPVADARSGSPDAWDTLFRRFQLPLYVFIQELVRNEQTSLDIVQETFAAAVKHLHSLNDDSKFSSWLFSIARQKCIQHWRRSARADALFEAALEPDTADLAPDPGQELLRKEEEQQFFALLEQLPPYHREVVLLHYLEDFPLDDIARITGVPPGTVKSRLFHAKRALRELRNFYDS